jgi:hypothetical protein
MASQLYNSGLLKLSTGDIVYLTDTMKIALLDNTYTPDIDSHDFFDDVSAKEISGTGYTAGGATLASKTATKDNTNDRVVFDAADVSWPSSTISSARYGVIYKSTGTASTSPLLAIIDFGADKSTTGDTFYIQFDSAGIFYLDQ